MSSWDADSADWVRALAAGNDEVMREFWAAYGASLERLARSRMSPALQRRLGADDIVQSVCRTFFRRAQQGQFALDESEALWRVFCALTLTKVRQHARFHLRKKRGMNREVPLAAESGSHGAWDPAAPQGITPLEAVAFADQMTGLMSKLDDEQRQIVEWKLEGLNSLQIAEKLGCSERTVRRLLDRVRERWSRELGRELDA